MRAQRNVGACAGNLESDTRTEIRRVASVFAVVIALSCVADAGPEAATTARGQCSPQEVAHLFASDGAEGDIFGLSLAISGDTAVVGASDDDTADGTNAGSAFVFVLSNGVWTEQAHLFASDGAAFDLFGASVAISGDTIVVGAVGDNTAKLGGTNAGSAYVFVRSGDVWAQQAHLFASDGAANDEFGLSVAISGDTIVVTAQLDNTADGTDAGSAYVFVRSGTVWTQQAHLFASDGAAGDRFGSWGAFSGDTAVVGAQLDDTPSGTNAGSAYVFVRDGAIWTEQAHLFASDGAAGDNFGFAVEVSGDTIAVGAILDDTRLGGADAGSAYVFVRDGAIWMEQAHLFASDGAADDRFTSDIAILGDTAVVGAHRDDTPGGTDAGSAYVFVRSGGVWTEQAHFFASDGAELDQFGYAVEISGDTVVVGAYPDDTRAGTDAGSAFVYDLNCKAAEPADLNGDGDVDGFDLALLLGQWTGATSYSPCPPHIEADLNSDCKINGFDLALLLGAWG